MPRPPRDVEQEIRDVEAAIVHLSEYLDVLAYGLANAEQQRNLRLIRTIQRKIDRAVADRADYYARRDALRRRHE